MVKEADAKGRHLGFRVKGLKGGDVSFFEKDRIKERCLPQPRTKVNARGVTSNW
jgi:hypothetical protein